MEKEIRIRNCAYQIWLDEGCPDGKSKEHWDKAREMVETEGEDRADKASKKKPAGTKTRSRKATSPARAGKKAAVTNVLVEPEK